MNNANLDLNKGFFMNKLMANKVALALLVMVSGSVFMPAQAGHWEYSFWHGRYWVEDPVIVVVSERVEKKDLGVEFFKMCANAPYEVQAFLAATLCLGSGLWFLHSIDMINNRRYRH